MRPGLCSILVLLACWAAAPAWAQQETEEETAEETPRPTHRAVDYLDVDDEAEDDAPLDLEEAALEARDRAREGYERLSRRRTFDIDGTPHGATGLPITFFTPASGLHYGGWLEVANYGNEPYTWRANGQWYLTTKGRRDHHFRVEVPAPFGYPVNARFLTRDVKNTGANFFGLGNDTEIDERRVEREASYYRYLLEQQQSAFDLEYAEKEPLVLFGGVRFNRAVPSRINEAKADAYYIFNLPPGVVRGRSGGWANFLLAGLIYDSRDDQELPTSGLLSEASLQIGAEILGANYVYRRLTLINTHYWLLPWPESGGPYVLTTRTVFESLGDDAPFYELTEVGGSIRGIQVGGGSFMRGFKSRRFADTHKLLLSAELRRLFEGRRWRGQNFEPLAMLFVDAGRVGADTAEALALSGMHPSAGIGGRVTWNTQLSLRIDIAASPEDTGVLISFGNLF
jgi:hypothetical protein